MLERRLSGTWYSLLTDCQELWEQDRGAVQRGGGGTLHRNHEFLLCASAGLATGEGRQQ